MLSKIQRMGVWVQRRGVLCILGAVIGVAGSLLLPDAAIAQGMRAGVRTGPGGMGQSAVTKRELDQWAGLLAMSKEQKEAAETLHQGYVTEFQAESKALQDIMKTAQQDFMESQDTGAFKDIAAKSAKHTDRMTALDQQFMEDVKALLDPKQAEQFPRVERHHRRVKALPAGMLSGESANLVTIMQDAGVDTTAGELKDAMEQYELDLDKAITDRDVQRKEIEKQSEEMMKDFDPSKMDFTKIRQMMQDTRKSGIKVRDTNERYARRLAALVPADKQADFALRTKRALFPAVYRDPYAVKAIDAALGFDDLSSEQKDSIIASKEAYLRELTAANEKWAAAIADEEKDGGGDPFMGFGKFVPGGATDEKPSPTEEAKKARRELDKTQVEKLKAILTDDQKERLPERKDENPWMMNLGGDDEADADEKPVKANRKK